MWGATPSIVVAGAIAAAAAPSSQPGPPNHRHLVSIGGKMHEPPERYDVWLEKLPDCTTTVVAAAKDDLPRRLSRLIKSKKVVAIRGELRPGKADCTLIGCACCNGCSFEWVLVPRAACPDRKVNVRQSGDYLSLRGGGSDCAVHGFGRGGARVIVTGRMAREDLLVDAALCRVRDDLRTERLEEADYARLMSGAPPRTPRCPPAPVPPPPQPAAKSAPAPVLPEVERLGL